MKKLFILFFLVLVDVSMFSQNPGSFSKVTTPDIYMPSGSAATPLHLKNISGHLFWGSMRLDAVPENDSCPWIHTMSGKTIIKNITDNVGIGTTNPYYKLTVNGVMGARGLSIMSTDTIYNSAKEATIDIGGISIPRYNELNKYGLRVQSNIFQGCSEYGFPVFKDVFGIQILDASVFLFGPQPNSNIGLSIQEIDSSHDANKRVNLLLGSGSVIASTTTPPEGTWNIYSQTPRSSYFSGKMGIGTTNVTNKLTVNGVISATGGTSTDWNAKQGALGMGTTNQWLRGDQSWQPIPTSQSFWSLIPGSTSNIYSTNTGTVAIGTTNPTTYLKLQVVAGNGKIPIWAESTNQSAIVGVSPYSYGGDFSSTTSSGLNAVSSSGSGVYGQSTSYRGGDFSSGTGTALYAKSTSGFGAIIETGNVGVGTTNPSAKLHSYTTSGNAIKGESTNSNAIYGIASGDAGVYGTSASGYGVRGNVTSNNSYGGYFTGASSNAGVYGEGGVWGGYFKGTNGVYAEATNSNYYSGIFMGGNFGVGITNPTNKLEVVGRTKTTDLTITNPVLTAGAYTVTFNSSGTFPPASTGVTSVTGTAPVVSSGGNTPAISMAAATGSVNGYLTSTDWTTFNNKVSMVYPGSGIPLSTGSAWGTSITNNSANWNTAYGWGDWSSTVALKAPLASPTFTGTVTLPSGLTGLAKVTSGVVSTITDNSTNWTSAYNWGNHASAGYLTTGLAASTYLTISAAASALSLYATLASPTFTGIVTASSVKYTATPVTDHTVSGDIVVLTANATSAIGDVGYINSSGKVQFCKADTISNCRYAIAICADPSIAANSSGNWLTKGSVKDATWSWTVGGLIYVSTSGYSGATLTQSAPAGANNVIMPIGVALGTDVMYFFGNINSVEHQ